MNKLSRGRGAASNPDNRYSALRREDFDDGWDTLEQPTPVLKTSLTIDTARSAIAYNDSPDVPFDRAVNPYRGCEHGCIYCYARPSHAWLGHSPGLDFESLLYYKPEIAKLLRQELVCHNYRCAPIALGSNTDCYQPVDRKLGLTRKIIELLAACHHPTLIITKSSLVERDIDLLQKLAADRCVQVMISITTLDAELSRQLEPRAAAPHRRLKTIQALAAAEIPVGLLLAPVIPVLTDPELENILQAARDAGATTARWIMLRLPREVAPLFQEWLENHRPLQAERVLSRIRDTRGGELYSADFAQRMSGSGEYARLLAQRFSIARKRLGFAESRELNRSLFRPPSRDERQYSLF
jgi:DNA repair photolyase